MKLLRRNAFTMIELLVVIAITAILMTVIVVPIIQSFNLTRSAQGWAQAQDKARTLSERIALEVSNAAGVRDNTGLLGMLSIVVPGRPGSGVTVPGYDTSHEWVRVPVYNAKLDLVKPFEGDPSLMRAGAFINPITGMADPTMQAPKGQVSLPASQGMTLVRWWIGVRDPLRVAENNSGLAGYIEPFTGLLEARSGQRDNLFVLYRAEVQPMIWNGSKFVVNKAFFYDLGRNTATGKTGPLYDDPTFFDPSLAYPAYNVPDPSSPDPTKAQMVQNWLAKAVIQTEVSRFDMIQPLYDFNSRKVQYEGDTPRLMTLISFRPTRVTSEPAAGQMAVRAGQETDSSGRIGPDVFTTKYLGWSNAIVRTFANTYNRGDVNNDKYMVGLSLENPGAADPQGFFIGAYDPEQGVGEDGQLGQVIGGNRVGTELMDLDVYKRGLRDGFRANFSRAITASNSRSGWLGVRRWRDLFEPYSPDAERGRAVASFNISDVGSVAVAFPYRAIPLPDPANNPNNLPGAFTWPDATPPLSPINDPNLVAGVFSDPQYSSINKRFNKLWHDYPGLHGNLTRFMDLRVIPNSDGAASPLNPDPMTGFSRARIVPGSEQIFGPDEINGPNFGNIVRYTRTTRVPGPNQYRINYTDLAEPDYSLLGIPAPPAVYTPSDLTSAIFQPRFKAGYIEFDSDPNLPLPGDNAGTAVNESNILVFYRFQFTQPDDLMAVDYDSRQLLTVQLTIRDYPQSSLPNPQTVTLHSSATVRNFLR